MPRPAYMRDRNRVDETERRARVAPSSFGALIRENQRFYVLALLLIVALLTGGSARGDVESLQALRPLAALGLAYGVYHLRREDVARYPIPFALLLAAFLLTALHLVPLPATMWRGLPGREIVATVDQAVDLGDLWRPFTLAPHAGWNALWAFLPPLATLVLAVQLELAQLRQLATLLLALGAISAVWGLLQILGGAESPFYVYAVSNTDSAVGAFANRNHQAMMLATLPPMLLTWAVLRRAARRSDGHAPRFYAVLALAAGAFILPMTFVTGSRAGAALIALSVAALPILTIGLQRNRRRRSSGQARPTRRLIWLLPAVAGLLVIVTLWFGRALSIDRFLAADEADARLKILPDVLDMTKMYAPWGSGFGSFEAVFALHEPARLLIPAYWNHAHNDWLEVALTGGVPALLLLAAAVIVIGARTLRVFAGAPGEASLTLLNRLGAMICVLLALGSFTDYPLRTPFLACLFVVALIWCFAKDAGERRHPSQPSHADHEKELTDE